MVIGVFLMLGHWRRHSDYQDFVVEKLGTVADKGLLLEYEDIISKLYILNLDDLLAYCAAFVFAGWKAFGIST